MANDGKDLLHEIMRLKELAQWYRGWAEVAGSDTERAARRALADRIETELRALLEPEPKRVD